MATLNGVYSASVVENRDPEGLARVLLHVPGLTDVIPGDLWARVATMMAGRNRGTWFIPEVGDEVLVAFERGDVKEAYVIGALQFDLNAKFHNPLRRQPEECRRSNRVPRHQYEQLFAPNRHAFPARDDDGFSPQEVSQIV
jgi:uncharacterized protein involved in type VI secretion and phage assembly